MAKKKKTKKQKKICWMCDVCLRELDESVDKRFLYKGNDILNPVCEDCFFRTEEFCCSHFWEILGGILTKIPDEISEIINETLKDGEGNVKMAYSQDFIVDIIDEALQRIKGTHHGIGDWDS